ncbi:MAG TPA: hypothetical protein VGA08_00700 [Candidatus Saccharimonadales bacterium]
MIKQGDIAVVILVVSISLVASYFLGNAIINTDANRSTEVEVINPISAEFGVPSDNIFNDEALNPTELIRIGDDGTNTPFVESND